MTDTRVFVANHNKRVVAILGLVFLSVALCSPLVLLGALTTTREDLVPNLLLGIIGLWGLVIFGWWGLWYLAALFRRDPALIASRDGLYDDSEPWSLGLIRWSEVRLIQRRRVLFWRVLTLQVYDHSAIVKRQRSLLKRLLFNFVSENEIRIRLNTMTEPMLGELLRRVEDARHSTARLPDGRSSAAKR